VNLFVDRHTASVAEMIVAFARENNLARIVGKPHSLFQKARHRISCIPIKTRWPEAPRELFHKGVGCEQPLNRFN
jgi:hypothetical protein